MKKGTKTMLSAAIVAVVFACETKEVNAESVTHENHTEAEKPFVLDQLIGTWKSEDGKSFERWKKNGDGSYRSEVYILRGKDTVFTENAAVYQEGGKWIFENAVAGENEGKTVRFTAVIRDEKRIQFSNPLHDFPNEINYTLRDNHTLNAFIVGNNETGGLDTIPFNYSRLR